MTWPKSHTDNKWQRRDSNLGLLLAPEIHGPSTFSPTKANQKQTKNPKTITGSNLGGKRWISFRLHTAVEHLRAFGINYFGSLGGSLIWLTNTPTVVTSHINNKCLTVTNPDHESVEHGVKQNHMCPDSKWDLTRPRVLLFNHRAAGL